ncbi:hypothetical protein [Prosthecodimorpha staleyi]|uniref:Uncharacterized protein n=1 Tax=Prosthecodimorpha staleyi TaxID=2840188 RepID=A0A947GBV7_9HYPH|nr:hypothetical protein [Prosthecodimorpha staleyi]MBT9290703.1 hypothetical protein [Prosthecodimorpha staleyi]
MERRIRLFETRWQPTIRQLATAQGRIADLAVSFPALLFALAHPRRGLDVRPALNTVLAGAPLADIAAALGVPMWLRRLQPSMFRAPLPALPDGPLLRHRIVNHLPRRAKSAAQWLETVAEAARWGEPDFVVWCAREAPTGAKPGEHDISYLALWHFFSQRPETQAGGCVDRRWGEAIGWDAAVTAARSFRMTVMTKVLLGDIPIADPWLQPATVGDFKFLPLLSAAAIIEEASVMDNCVRGLAGSVAWNRYRVWSVHRNGERLATIGFGTTSLHPFVFIDQVKAKSNRRPDPEVLAAVHGWFEGLQQIRRDTWGKRSPEVNAERPKVWRALWRPYWLERRRLPTWLPLSPNERPFGF